MSRYTVTGDKQLRRCASVTCSAVFSSTGRKGRPPVLCSACSFKQRRRGKAIPKRPVDQRRLVDIAPVAPVEDVEEVIPEPRPAGAEKSPVEQHDKGRCARCLCIRWLYSFVGKPTKVCGVCIARLRMHQLATGVAA